MEALLARAPGASKTEAIERAISAFLARDALDELRALAGRLDIEDVSGALRNRDRAT